MSQESVEIVRHTFAALNAFMRGEQSSEALAELLSPRITSSEWQPSMPGAPQEIRGGLGFMNWLNDIRDTVHEVALEPHEFIDAGGQVVVPFTVRLIRDDGSEVPARATWIWTIRDGAV